MYGFNYREFYKQEQLFDDYNRLSADGKDQTILLACDKDKEGTMKEKGLKFYAKIYYDLLFLFIKGLTKKNRCFYELIKPKELCRMYFDIDGIVNPHNLEKITYLLENFHKDFVEFWNYLKNDNEGGCKVLNDSNVDANKIPDVLNIYSSTNERKISYHILFPNIVMKNNFHCGAIMRRFEIYIIEKKGENVEKNPYFFQSKDDGYEFAIDRGVYTTCRLMRILKNTKGGQKRFLRFHSQSFYDVNTNQVVNKSSKYLHLSKKKIFKQSFIQNLKHDYPEFYECCEVRSAHFYENPNRSLISASLSNSSNSIEIEDEFSTSSLNTLNWIEPSTVGAKIISMSNFRLKRMKLNRFLAKRFKNESAHYSDDDIFLSNTRLWSPDTSACSSPSRDIEDERVLNNSSVINEHLFNLFNMITGAFKLPLQKTADNFSKYYTNVLKAAETYIRKRCAPNWWPRPDYPFFTILDPEKMINIKNGTVHIYPREKRCQFKSFHEHSGNHVYFIIFTTDIYGKTGIVQKCHSFHHDRKPSNIIQPPFIENDEDSKNNFMALQKCMKSYTKRICLKAFDIVEFEKSEYNDSAWIYISSFNCILGNFMKSITNDIFCMFNQISNVKYIYTFVEKMINQIWYYLNFSKNQNIFKIIFRLTDEIVIRSAKTLQHTYPKISEYFIHKYAIFRYYLILFSYSNILMKNNFNNLNDRDFLLMISLFSDCDYNLPKSVISKRKNSSILYIQRIAAVTEKKIMDRYNSISNEPIIDLSQEPTENLTVKKFIETTRNHVSEFFKRNYQFCGADEAEFEAEACASTDF